MNVDQNAEGRFLVEGAGVFVDTLNAVEAFRELVQSRCRRVLQKHLVAYSAALGVHLDMHHFQPYQRPRPTDWDGQWVSVGLQAGNVGKAKVWLVHSVYWGLEAEGKWSIEVGSGIFPSKRNQVALLRKAFRPRPRNLYVSEDDREVWLGEPVTPAEFSGFDQKLDAVFRRWIKLWERIGGLKVLTEGG